MASVPAAKNKIKKVQTSVNISPWNIPPAQAPHQGQRLHSLEVFENCAEDKTKVEKKQKKKISVKGNAKDKTHAIEVGKGSVAGNTSGTAATDEEEIGDE